MALSKSPRHKRQKRKSKSKSKKNKRSPRRQVSPRRQPVNQEEPSNNRSSSPYRQAFNTALPIAGVIGGTALGLKYLTPRFRKSAEEIGKGLGEGMSASVKQSLDEYTNPERLRNMGRDLSSGAGIGIKPYVDDYTDPERLRHMGQEIAWGAGAGIKPYVDDYSNSEYLKDMGQKIASGAGAGIKPYVDNYIKPQFINEVGKQLGDGIGTGIVKHVPLPSWMTDGSSMSSRLPSWLSTRKRRSPSKGPFSPTFKPIEKPIEKPVEKQLYLNKFCYGTLTVPVDAPYVCYVGFAHTCEIKGFEQPMKDLISFHEKSIDNINAISYRIIPRFEHSNYQVQVFQGIELDIPITPEDLKSQYFVLYYKTLYSVDSSDEMINDVLNAET